MLNLLRLILTAQVEGEKRPYKETYLRPRGRSRPNATSGGTPQAPVLVDSPTFPVPPSSSAPPSTSTLSPSSTLLPSSVPLATTEVAQLEDEAARTRQDRGKAIQVGGLSWMQPLFWMPSSPEGLKNLGEEIMASAPPLRNIKFMDHFVASFLDLHAARWSADLNSYQVLKEICAYKSANCVGALLSRVSMAAFMLHIYEVSFILTITCSVLLFQFNAHFLHLYNLASAGES